MRSRSKYEGQEIPNIGTQLRRRRVELGITQQELATSLGITKAGLSAYEQDKITPTPDNLVRLSDVLGVSVDYFLNKTVDEGETQPGRLGRIGDRQIGIGRQITGLRNEKGLSRAELASRLDITEDALSKIEKDLMSPSYGMLVKMSRLFGVSTERLFGIDTGKIIDISGLSEDNRKLIKDIVRNMR